MKKNVTIEKSPDRLAIIEKIKEYEKNGWFDKDVENDPPTRPLKEGECDFTQKKLSTKIATKIANFIGRRYIDKQLKNKTFIIKEVKGLENLEAVKGGAFITCNHFNVCDNFAVYKVMQPYLDREKRCLYKVIREGNYTSFTGLYGYFFRHCNTLPLSENFNTLKEFYAGVKELIARGEKILIYPEQGMWWNYKKPRPLKDGAFNLAAKYNAPVIPFFITMTDSDIIGADGFPVQEYHITIMPAVYPDENKTIRENSAALKEKNYSAWVKTYEDFYGKKLSYEEE